MVKKRTLSPLSILDQKALPEFLHTHDYKELHTLTIWRYMAQNPDASFNDIPGIPKTLRALLREHFVPFTTSVTTEQRSCDGTIKLLIKLQDEHEIEAVIMQHKGRNTLCVSSQVGCQMACTFCATGTLGIIADLCSGEILEQLAHANRVAPIRNVVFMGMGEPLNNYDAVLAAIRAMTKVFGLAPKHITLSTVGVIHRIRQLSRDAPLVRLALSLHAPTQEMRSEIVPTSTAYPLDKLMAAIDDHLAIKYVDSVVFCFVCWTLIDWIGDVCCWAVWCVQGGASSDGGVLHVGGCQRLDRDCAHAWKVTAGPISAREPHPIQHY
jgi:adenine C2-methylase RlmN of 23S rRNA A2503 and tRNA A37